MDVELQILKHLKREAQPTVYMIDQYCSAYKSLFTEVRSYECFKYLHQGIISPIKRKSLPEIAKVVGINSSQSLHHFIANSPWSATKLEEKRLAQTKKALKGKKITVIIDETGDRKKGTKTDYVARQYLGSVGKIDQGIVSVNVYGLYDNITFPLKFKIFKPKGTLKKEDKYKTKIELASEIITELIDFAFDIELVLADSLYGEASSFIRKLEQYKLAWVVAIRSNHGVWLPKEQIVRANKWCKFEGIFNNQKSETRYIREIIFGKRKERTYWSITTDPETMPENLTSLIMTNVQDKRSNLKRILGNLYGLRTWIEYSFRQCKQELGWTNYRFTNFKDIEQWWEIIMSAYLMISLNTQAFLTLNSPVIDNSEVTQKSIDFSSHPQWNHQTGWKNVLNNFRLQRFSSKYGTINDCKSRSYMKAYSVDFREKIVSAIEKGDSSVRKVAQRFGVSKNCVQKLMTQKRTKGHILPGKQSGSMISPVMTYKDQLIAIFEQRNDATLAEYCELLYDETGLWVSQSTMCRISCIKDFLSY